LPLDFNNLCVRQSISTILAGSEPAAWHWDSPACCGLLFCAGRRPGCCSPEAGASTLGSSHILRPSFPPQPLIIARAEFIDLFRTRGHCRRLASRRSAQSGGVLQPRQFKLADQVACGVPLPGRARRRPSSTRCHEWPCWAPAQYDKLGSSLPGHRRPIRWRRRS
jgi:hypothetical protein